MSVAVLGSWVNGTTHTVEAGSNRLLLVFGYCEHNGVITSTGATYGTKTMTLINTEVSGATYRDRIAAYYLNDADIALASNSTVAVTWSATPSEGSSIESVFLSGVKQSSPIGANATATSASGTTLATVALATVNGDMGFASMIDNAASTFVFNNGFTKDYDGSHTKFDECAGHIVCTGADITPSITGASGRIAIIGFVVNNGKINVVRSVISNIA